MRYALTYATDDTWNSVDTILVESNKPFTDMSDEEVADIFEAYGLTRQQAMELAQDGDYWFVRDVRTVDVDLTREGR